MAEHADDRGFALGLNLREFHRVLGLFLTAHQYVEKGCPKIEMLPHPGNNPLRDRLAVRISQ